MKPFQWMAIGLVCGLMIFAYAKDQDKSSDAPPAEFGQSGGQIEKGTVLTMTLQTALSSEYSHTGDPIITVLASDILQDGKVIVAKGTEVYGEVTRSVPASASNDKKGKLSFVLNEIEGAGGRKPISLSLLSTERRESQVDQTARTRTRLAGTAIGSLLGANMAANEDKNKLKGALFGGAAGLAVGSLVAQQQGVDVEVSSGSKIRARVDSLVEVK